MKPTIFSLVFLLVMGTAYAQSDDRPSDEKLNEYMDFLQSMPESPKDYIFRLFETYDNVVVCERDHRDMTQYELYFDIVTDERFQGGNILMEVGVSNAFEEINDFLRDKSLSEDQVEQRLISILRRIDYYPLWEKTNYPVFLRKLHYYNRELPQEKQVTVYPVDVPFSWEEMDNRREYERFRRQFARYPGRDSVMGLQMVERIGQIAADPSRNKRCLILMNNYHADFNVSRSASAYVKRAFPEETVNVMVSWMRQDREQGRYFLLDEGRWDAAFKWMGIREAGFDLAGTPFGRTPANQYHDRYTADHQIENVFHGFIFYRPIEEIVLSQGYPGLIDKGFRAEMRRRNRVLLGSFKAFFAGAQENYYNRVRTWKYEDLDHQKLQRDRWLHR